MTCSYLIIGCRLASSCSSMAARWHMVPWAEKAEFALIPVRFGFRMIETGSYTNRMQLPLSMTWTSTCSSEVGPRSWTSRLWRLRDDTTGGQNSLVPRPTSTEAKGVQSQDARCGEDGVQSLPWGLLGLLDTYGFLTGWSGLLIGTSCFW
jgi:hypothetical protein